MDTDLLSLALQEKPILVSTYRPKWGFYQWSDQQDISGRKSIELFWNPGSGRLSGYELGIVPANSRIEAMVVKNHQPEVVMRFNYRPAKALVALIQLLYSATTLYRARGHQVSTFGYAAFGLTVAPYAIMSFMNLLSALLCPDYEGMYLVQSSVLDEARRAMPNTKFPTPVGRLMEKSNNPFQLISCTFRGLHGVPAEAQITGEASSLNIEVTKVSRIAQDRAKQDRITYKPITHKLPRAEWGADQKPPYLMVPQCNPVETTLHPIRLWLPGLQSADHSIKEKNPVLQFDKLAEGIIIRRSTMDFISLTSSTVVYSAIVATVGGISRFRQGESTFAQRFWTMSWLATGLSYVLILGLFDILNSKLRALSTASGTSSRTLDVAMTLAFLLALPLLATPAIGGLVVVGQMLKSYGTCTEFT
jgi:hypothetical protein